MAISCILRQVPRLTATVIINKYFSVETRYLHQKHFIHNSCSFSTCFMSHLFVICRNYGMKIKILLGIRDHSFFMGRGGGGFLGGGT